MSKNNERIFNSREVRNKVINFRCSESERNELNKLAKQNYVSLASLIRTALDNLKGHLEPKEFDNIEIENLKARVSEVENSIQKLKEVCEK